MELHKKRTFPKKETNLIKQFMEMFHELLPDVFYWKTHGEPMQVRGIPDIIICFEGLFFGMEFKIMRHGEINVTPYQESTIKRIIKAGGYTFIIWWDEKTSDVGIQMKRFRGKDAIKQGVDYVIQEMWNIKTVICKEGEKNGS